MIFKTANDHFLAGDYDKAIAEYETVPETHPLYSQAQFNIGLARARSKSKTNIAVRSGNNAGRSETPPLLSIVMPVFNVAPYLDTSIVSALTQDYPNFELIIVDDKSSDNGRRIVEMHAAQDQRIRVIALDHNTLGGAGIPSNIGVREARGEYLAFIDSDDWVTKTAFAKMIALAEEHAADVVIGDFCTFTEDERRVSEAYDRKVWKNLPLRQVISIATHPQLLRLSPVPWRKIYRREFLSRYRILYPEGDYFYEDNALHWFVLARATRVVVCDELVSYHRMGREGQTMGSSQYKLAALTSHINTIWNFISRAKDLDQKHIIPELYDYISRSDWIIKRQVQPAAAAMIKRRFASIIDRITAAEGSPGLEALPNLVRKVAEYRTAYPDIDLTVIMPVHNCADLIRDSIHSILAIQGLQFNLLLIDDGSTDNSLSVLREYEKNYANVHAFQQAHRGAGRARNSLIPLATGRYTYFMDADDVIDAEKMTLAVREADRAGNDLLFFQYRIEYYDEGRSRGMFDADAEIWKKLSVARTNRERQEVAARLINYPWNRIIRTQLLHDANIFFGPTMVHNDIQFHWHSIASAADIGSIDAAICTHRKFRARSQITNIADNRRMAALEALRFAHQVIRETTAFSALKPHWEKFSASLLDWARERIPEALRPIYDEKRSQLLALGD